MDRKKALERQPRTTRVSSPRSTPRPTQFGTTPYVAHRSLDAQGSPRPPPVASSVESIPPVNGGWFTRPVSGSTHRSGVQSSVRHLSGLSAWVPESCYPSPSTTSYAENLPHYQLHSDDRLSSRPVPSTHSSRSGAYPTARAKGYPHRSAQPSAPSTASYAESLPSFTLSSNAGGPSPLASTHARSRPPTHKPPRSARSSTPLTTTVPSVSSFELSPGDGGGSYAPVASTYISRSQAGDEAHRTLRSARSWAPGHPSVRSIAPPSPSPPSRPVSRYGDRLVAPRSEKGSRWVHAGTPEERIAHWTEGLPVRTPKTAAEPRFNAAPKAHVHIASKPAASTAAGQRARARERETDDEDVASLATPSSLTFSRASTRSDSGDESLKVTVTHFVRTHTPKHSEPRRKA